MAVVVEVIQNDGIDVEVAGERYAAPGGGDTPVVSGGVQSVNYIKPDENGNVNVLGWEEEVPAQTITFDGNLEGLEYVTFDESEEASQYYVKLSNTVPAAESFIGSTLSYVMEGEPQTVEVTNDMIRDMGEQGYSVGDVLMVATADLTAGDKVITAGVWTALVTANGVPFIYTSQITLPGCTVVQKIDKKFLPDESIKVVVIRGDTADATSDEIATYFPSGKGVVFVDLAGDDNVYYVGGRYKRFAADDGTVYWWETETIIDEIVYKLHIGANGEVLRKEEPLTVGVENITGKKNGYVEFSFGGNYEDYDDVRLAYDHQYPTSISARYVKLSDEYYDPDIFVGGYYITANINEKTTITADSINKTYSSWYFADVIGVPCCSIEGGVRGCVLDRGIWIRYPISGVMYTKYFTSGRSAEYAPNLDAEYIPYNGLHFECISLYGHETSYYPDIVSHNASQIRNVIEDGKLPMLLENPINSDASKLYEFLGISLEGVARFRRQEGLDLKYIEIDESGMVTRTTDTSAKDALKAEIVDGVTNAIPTAEGGSF